MRGTFGIGCVIGMALANSPSAVAADLSAKLAVKAPVRAAIYDWTGFYVGGHFGYGDASFGPDTNPFPLQGALLPHSPTGLIGGFQMGYNRQLTNRVVLGVEADASFTSPPDGAALTPAPFN